MRPTPETQQRNCLALLNYWESLWTPGAVPAQAQIQPRALKSFLPNVFVLDASDPSAPVFALAGTGLCAQFGSEQRGLAFLSWWEAGSRDSVRAIVRRSQKALQPAFLQSAGTLAESGIIEVLIAMAPIAFRDMGPVRFVGVAEIVNELPWFNRGFVMPLRLLDADLVPRERDDGCDTADLAKRRRAAAA